MGESTSADPVTVASDIIKDWDEQHRDPLFNPLNTLNQLADLVEKEMENYLKMDPDPFDDRHPSRADPKCTLGLLLKTLFKKDNLMNKLVNDYMRENTWSRLTHEEIREINTSSCRLLLDIMPGLETSVIFKESEGLITKLFHWAERTSDPLCSYAIGILAAAMEVQDIAANFREQNAILVPQILKKIKDAQDQFLYRMYVYKSSDLLNGDGFIDKDQLLSTTISHSLYDSSGLNLKLQNNIAEMKHSTYLNGEMVSVSESSNSSWADLESFVIGMYQIYPLTLATKQILLLRYLTPMGEYQELLGNVFEYDALGIILKYINLKQNHNVRVAFEALKYLAALLCHKKFCLEFISVNGVQKLLEIPRPSIAATGVSMCLYYLACSEEAMERICVLPHYIVEEIVKYALWLLECSHESGRCYATMFFGFSFRFKLILEIFDQQDGLRKLYNVVSTLLILSGDEQHDFISEDEEFAARQTVRHVCMAIKRYFEVHLISLSEQLQRLHTRDQGVSPQQLGASNCKAMTYTPESIQESIQLVQLLFPHKKNWSPVNSFLKLNCANLLLRIIGMSYDWNYSGRAETVRSALDILCICAVIPGVQEIFCEKIDLPDDNSTTGMNIILWAAVGEVVADADVQKSALNLIIACVCAPSKITKGAIGRYNSVGSVIRKHGIWKSADDLLLKMWNCVRSNNGIMVLLKLLLVKTPITDADSIRCLACRALVGLARWETVRQIIGKLPLFTSGQIQILMREPILQEKRSEHVKFCKFALELLELISGKKKKSGNEFEVSLSTIHKADVVAQTKISYNEKQLLQLICFHLMNKGYKESSSVLQKEANLTIVSKFGLSNFSSPVRCFNSISLANPGSLPRRISVSSVSRMQGTNIASPRTLIINPPGTVVTNGNSKFSNNCTLNLNCTPSCSRIKDYHITSRIIQKQISGRDCHCSPVHKYSASMLGSNDMQMITLDNIITEYLMNQHRLCKNPMVTCPQFDLFLPHQCPDPKSNKIAPCNLTARISNRTLLPKHGGLDGEKLTQKLIHSRFRPLMLYRSSEDDMFFTTCCFSACEQFVMAGTFNGDMKLFNAQTGTEEASYQCHNSTITNLIPNRDGSLLLTSSVIRPHSSRDPLSALWTLGDFFDMKLAFEDEEYVEFSNLVQDKVVATLGNTARVYDIYSGKIITSLSPQCSNQYTRNKSTFNPTDDLILCDGVLWDVSSATVIHKFDKLNQTFNGVFHPNGLEIISNTEVWDIRTFHLLHTVSNIDQSIIRFNTFGNIFYAFTVEEEAQGSDLECNFRTVDAHDYSNIATIDVKKCIYDLAINSTDTQIAVVENSDYDDGVVDESWVRVYEVGRNRDMEDEVEQEEEDIGDSDGSDTCISDNENTVDLADEIIDLLEPESGDNEDQNDEFNQNNDDETSESGSLDDLSYSESLSESDVDNANL